MEIFTIRSYFIRMTEKHPLILISRLIDTNYFHFYLFILKKYQSLHHYVTTCEYLFGVYWCIPSVAGCRL